MARKRWYLPDGTVTSVYQPGAVSSISNLRNTQAQQVASFFDIEDGMPVERTRLEPLPVIPPLPVTPRVTAVLQTTVAPEVGGSLRNLLLRLYPERIQPALGRGLTVDALEQDFLSQIQSEMNGNPQGFLQTLASKRMPNETRALMRYLNIPDDVTDKVVGINQTQTQIINALSAIPELDRFVSSAATPGATALDKLAYMLEQTPDRFLGAMRVGGITREKSALLRLLGIPDTAINQLLPELPPTLPESNLKNLWDSFRLGVAGAGQKTKQFFMTTLPQQLLAGIQPPEGTTEEGRQIFEEGKKELVTEFRRTYTKNQQQFETWQAQHPELQPRRDYAEGAAKHPELFKDPWYWAYEIASNAPSIMATAAIGVAVTGVTGNPFAGAAAGGLSMLPLVEQDLIDDLLENGATEDQALQMGTMIGPLLMAVEGVGNIPFLKAVSPAIMRSIRKEITAEITKLTLAQLAKKGIATATKIELAEIMEEVTQQAIQNATVGVVNKERRLFEGIKQTAISTAMATLPLALVGGGASIAPGALRDVTETTKRLVSETDATVPGKPPPVVTEAARAQGVGDVEVEVEKVTQRWSDAKSRNSSLARKDLEKLEQQGFDVGDSKSFLDEYSEVKRSDFDDAESFSEARTEAWDEFLDSLSSIEKVEPVAQPQPVVSEAARAQGVAKVTPAPVVTPIPSETSVIADAIKSYSAEAQAVLQDYAKGAIGISQNIQAVVADLMKLGLTRVEAKAAQVTVMRTVEKYAQATFSAESLRAAGWTQNPETLVWTHPDSSLVIDQAKLRSELATKPVTPTVPAIAPQPVVTEAARAQGVAKVTPAPEVTGLVEKSTTGIKREIPTRPMSEVEKFLQQEAEIARFVKELPIGKTFKYVDESSFKMQEGKILGITESQTGETLIRIKSLAGKEFTVSPEYLASTYGLSIEEQVAKLIERTKRSIRVAKGEGIYKDYADKTLQAKYEAELTTLETMLGQPPVKPPAVKPSEPPRVATGEIPPAKVTSTEVKQTDFTNKYMSSKGQKPPPPTEPPSTTTKMPEDMPFSQQVANHISFDPEKETLASRFLRGKNKAMSQWIDKLYPIDTFVSEAKKLGADIPFEENPYMLARLLEGNVSKATTFIEDGTFGRAFWKIKAGKAIPSFKGKGLSQILSEVKEPEQWRDFSTYLTAQRARELSNFGIASGITDDVATKAIAELEAKYPRFARLSDDIQKYQSHLLDYMQESGLLSPDLRKALDNKYASYVPFYRVLEELQGTGYTGKKMVNIATPIKRIKGSEKEIINPLESIVKNTYAFINAADRNQVGVAMARLTDAIPELAGLLEPIRTPIAKVATVSAKELGVEIAGLSDEAIEGVFNIFRPQMFTDDNVVTILIEGKKNFFKVDPDLKVALKAMDTTNMGLLWKILASPAKWLRAGATLSPDFMVRNPLRDAGTAFVYSNYGFIPGVDFLRGVGHLVGKTETYKLFKMSGGEHSMLVSLDREYLTKSFKEIVGGKGFTDYVKHPLGLLQIGSELGEKATRLGEFAKAINSGALPLPAGMSAREITLDFAKAGTQARALNQIIAFFNANIRGWDRMVTAFKDHPIRTSFKVTAGITLPSIVLWSLNHDDPRWAEIPQWQKDLFWIVMTDDNIYRIPKPFELGVIFGSGPERLLDYLNAKDPRMGKKLLENFLGAGLPGGIPTAALPIIENITNYSFFRDRPIVPPSKQDLPPELQYTEYTSELAKGMGKLLKQSPMKIDNLLFGWTGGLGRYATEGIDKILELTGIVPDKIEPSSTLADLPVAKAFVVRSPLGSSSESVNTFYEEMEAITAIEKLLKSYIEDGKSKDFEKLKAEHPEVLFQYDAVKNESYSATARYLRRVSGELADIRKLQDKIYKATNMTPEKKRELITQLDALITDMAVRALALIKHPSDEVALLQTPVSDIEAKLGTTTNSPLAGDNVTLKDIASDLVKATGSSPLKKLMERNNDILIDIGNLPDLPLYKVDRLTYRGGLTKRQNELLDDYETAVDKKAFLNEHPELKLNPKVEWLTNNPEGNAILALWGNAKLYTQKAYDIVMKMVEDNDIPNNALEEKVLPPKNLAKPYFEFQDILRERDEQSWEAKLHLGNNDKLREFLGLKPIDTPIASLELKVKNRGNFDKLEALSDEDSPDYIADEKDRAKATKKLKVGTEFGDDLRRIEAIEKRADERAIKAHVEYGKLIDKDDVAASSAEVMLFRVDNPDYDKWRQDKDIWGDQALKPVEESRIPIWRLDVKYRKEDKEYDALPAEGTARADYLQKNEAYRKDRRRREAYVTKMTEVENFVAYHELADKGYRRERFLIDNAKFGEEMHMLKGIDLPDPTKVPAVQYDDIYDQFKDTFDELEGLSDSKSKSYVEDPEDRNLKRQTLLFTQGKYNDFGKAWLRREAYGQFVPEERVDAFVGYYTIIGEGKGRDYAALNRTDRWYEDDWFLMENLDFYKEVYIGLLGNEKKDFRKIPGRMVFSLYLVYLQLPEGTRRENFRIDNTTLDDWGVLAGIWSKPMKEQRRREGLTPADRFKEDINELRKRIEQAILR